MAPLSLEGKVALVTGATGGIGRAVAEALAAAGATVILGVRSTEAGGRAADQIRSRHPGAAVEVATLPLDLSDLGSVRAFAAAVNRRPGPLHILVNNAGISHTSRCFTPQGVGMLAQINHLGPYVLTRLLEGKLVSSKARVVFVSSVTHRIASIRDAYSFLTSWRECSYGSSKLANTLMAFELQRRLGAAGLQACAVDPGAVRTAIFDASPLHSSGTLLRRVVDGCYAPPEDGAIAVVHAATCDWEEDRRPQGAFAGKRAPPPEQLQDLRLYARGTFAWRALCSDWAQAGGLRMLLWELGMALLTSADWPLRRALGEGEWTAATRPVRASSRAYDERLACELWEASARIAGLPAEPQL